MKRYLVIIITFLFVLSSCDSDLRRAKRYYHEAQDMITTDPDSTLILIDSILNITVFLDDDIRMNMSLMQAGAIFNHPDGERRELSGRIKAKKIYTMPELEHASDFYVAENDYSKASYAALYSGYVQREIHNNDAAMLCFKDATKYAEIIGDSLNYTRAQYNVARILMDGFLFDDALLTLKSIYKFSGNDYVDKANLLNIMAVSYIMLDDYYDAEECIKNGLLYASKIEAPQIRWNLLNNYSVLYRERGDYSMSIQCLRQIEKETDSTNIIKLLVNMGKVYMACHENDSAAVCFNNIDKLLCKSDVNPATKLSAYGAISYFAELNDDYQLALKYSKKYAKLQYQIQDTLRKENIYRIQRQYDYETMQNNMNRRIISNYRIEMTMAVALVMILAVALVLYYRIMQKNKKEAEIKAALLRVMRDNETLIRNKSDNLSAKLRSMQRLEILAKDQKDKCSLANLEKEMFGDKNHWEVMKDLFNTLYPGLYDTLKDKYPKMSELERRVYMLSRFKLSRIDEALLLDVSTSVLDKARGKVKRTLEQENLFDNFI